MRLARLLIACAGLMALASACTGASSGAVESAPDMKAEVMMQICRTAGDAGDDSDVQACGLVPVPDGTVKVISQSETIWEGELRSDGTVEATFESSSPWHVEVSAPLLDEPMVSPEFEPTGSQTQGWFPGPPTLTV